MKAYKGYEAKKSSGGVQLPVAGAYIGKIFAARVENNQFDTSREQLVLMLDITDGEYANRYHEAYESSKERFGGDVKYRGSLRVKIPKETDSEEQSWIKNVFEGAIWAIQESNPGYAWDWDEKSLKDKKVGFSVRDSYYTYNGQDKQSTEIGRLESIEEVKAGKVKPMKARDSRKESEESTDGSSFTDVSKDVDVPF